jgi:hypothetical protein
MKGVAWADADPLAGQKLMGGFGSIHQQAVEVLADNAYSRLEDVNNVVGRRVDDVFRSVALEHSKGSVIGYQTTRQTAKRIREDLAERGITGFVDKAGHEWDMRRYAKVLAQETTNGAFRQGTINRLQEKGHDLVRISTHSGACKLCTPWEGRTLSLSGGDKDYPSLDEARGAGLMHVGCLHVISLAPEEKDRFIGRLQGKEGEAARQAEIDRLAAKWNATHGGETDFGLKEKVVTHQPKDAHKAREKITAPARSTAPTQPVQIETKTGAKGEPLPGKVRITANPGDEIHAKVTLDNFNSMPAKLRAACNEIAILPKPSADDVRLSKMYGYSVRTDAAHDPVHKRILGFPGADGKSRPIDKGLMAHELAHPLDESLGNISSKMAWSKYAAKDGKFVSEYAADYYKLNGKSFKEDFADSIKAYVTDHDNFVKEFPNRADYIRRKILD